MDRAYSGDEEIVCQICNEIKNSFQNWQKKCSIVRNAINQIEALDRSKWELFELPESYKENLRIALITRLVESFEALRDEIDILNSHKLNLNSIVNKREQDCSKAMEERLQMTNICEKKITLTTEGVTTPNHRTENISECKLKTVVSTPTNLKITKEASKTPTISPKTPITSPITTNSNSKKPNSRRKTPDKKGNKNESVKISYEKMFISYSILSELHSALNSLIGMRLMPLQRISLEEFEYKESNNVNLSYNFEGHSKKEYESLKFLNEANEASAVLECRLDELSRKWLYFLDGK